MPAAARGPILVVEDNEETRYLLERILALKGYTTSSVEDVPAALRYLRDGKRASVILLDLHLPGMDGRALLREMKAIPDLPDIPVVVYSGDPGTVPDVAACVRKGTDDPEVLLKAIAACLK